MNDGSYSVNDNALMLVFKLYLRLKFVINKYIVNGILACCFSFCNSVLFHLFLPCMLIYLFLYPIIITFVALLVAAVIVKVKNVRLTLLLRRRLRRY